MHVCLAAYQAHQLQRTQNCGAECILICLLLCCCAVVPPAGPGDWPHVCHLCSCKQQGGPQSGAGALSGCCKLFVARTIPPLSALCQLRASRCASNASPALQLHRTLCLWLPCSVLQRITDAQRMAMQFVVVHSMRGCDICDVAVGLHLCCVVCQMLCCAVPRCAVLCRAVLQVRRSTYHEVLKLAEAQPLLQIKGERCPGNIGCFLCDCLHNAQACTCLFNMRPQAMQCAQGDVAPGIPVSS
jgi:hypothetical protein